MDRRSSYELSDKDYNKRNKELSKRIKATKVMNELFSILL
jgi:hypothetical protein